MIPWYRFAKYRNHSVCHNGNSTGPKGCGTDVIVELWWHYSTIGLENSILDGKCSAY